MLFVDSSDLISGKYNMPKFVTLLFVNPLFVKSKFCDSLLKQKLCITCLKYKQHYLKSQHVDWTHTLLTLRVTLPLSLAPHMQKKTLMNNLSMQTQPVLMCT